MNYYCIGRFMSYPNSTFLFQSGNKKN